MTAPLANMFSVEDELQVFSESRQRWLPGRVKAVGYKLLLAAADFRRTYRNNCKNSTSSNHGNNGLVGI